MRAYLIERTTMEWSRIASQLRGLVEQHERNGINFGDYAGGREVVAFLEDVRGMTRYDDQHAFPDQPPVELPERVHHERITALALRPLPYDVNQAAPGGPRHVCGLDECDESCPPTSEASVANAAWWRKWRRG